MKQTGLLTLALLLACASPVFAEGMDLSVGNSEFMRGPRSMEGGMEWQSSLSGSGSAHISGPSGGAGAYERHPEAQAVDELYEQMVHEESISAGGGNATLHMKPQVDGKGGLEVFSMDSRF